MLRHSAIRLNSAAEGGEEEEATDEVVEGTGVAIGLAAATSRAETIEEEEVASIELRRSIK